ncbi:GNAT family N-acetyltransferase [Neotabrizicola sp. VNH66]|uniref:GNAT family N-acetyltransferase n=1 Tax=Neotabrizicola sp. VNH66 TaxID=3400918 RepID=UPI003C056089
MKSVSLTTDRLVLRPPMAEDCGAYLAYATSDRTRFVGGPRDRFAAIEKFAGMIGHWALRGYGRLILTNRATGAALGHVGPLNFADEEVPELTWTLWTATAEGQGIASEAALAACRWIARDLGFARAVTSIHRDNIASQRIATRLGGRATGDAAPHLAGAVVWDFDLAALAGPAPMKEEQL